MKLLEIEAKKSEIIKILQKAIQSCNINFLIGSGCSCPGIPVLGNFEQEIEKLINDKNITEADNKKKEFLKPFIENVEFLKNHSLDVIFNHKIDSKKKIEKYDTIDNYSITCKNYNDFINNISTILFKRRSNILHKQATIFTTNYDLFIEKVIESYSDSLFLNDGFYRNSSLNQMFSFSPKNFFNKVYNTGNLYKYQVEIPSINLIKLHGSLNWKANSNKIFQSLNLNEDDKLEEISIILPTKEKFKTTLLNQTYYDLLRLFSNELDKENTLLIVEGFSFADEHIFELTKRALKNPTLLIIIFCRNKDKINNFEKMFSEFNNLNIIYSNKEYIDFQKFNSLIKDILPKWEENKGE